MMWCRWPLSSRWHCHLGERAIGSVAMLGFGNCVRVEARDAAVGPNDEGQREGVPVAVVEGVPGLAIVARKVGAVGTGGDPEFEGIGVLHCGAEAVRGSG